MQPPLTVCRRAGMKTSPLVTEMERAMASSKDTFSLS